MTMEQLQRAKTAKGFIAALDQSGGSTPKALRLYGILEDAYSNEEEMYLLIHKMRSRIMTNSSFTSDKILGAILFEQTMRQEVEGKPSAQYLLDKGILPFLKIDKGLEEINDGVQLMKPIPELDALLKEAVAYGIFGTKERSNIMKYNQKGICAVVNQQFALAKKVIAAGLIPIVEPEVNIYAEDKAKIEEKLKEEIIKHLDTLNEDQNVMLKLTLPTVTNAYEALVNHPRVVRVVALSGGYSLQEANEKLKANSGVIASFSRALTNDLRAEQSDEKFTKQLSKAIDTIYEASIS